MQSCPTIAQIIVSRPLRELQDGPRLDRSVRRQRDLRRHGDSLVDIASFYQVISSELLLGLGERPVGDQPLTGAHANGLAGRGGLQRVAALDRRCELLTERSVLGGL